MLRDNLVGLIEPMLSSAGAYPLALCTARKKPSDDRPPCLENPRPEGAESTLTENAASPFHAEPKHDDMHLSPQVLADAEDEAMRVYRKAGVAISWVECKSARTKAEPDVRCQDSPSPTRLNLRIVPHASKAS